MNTKNSVVIIIKLLQIFFVVYLLPPSLEEARLSVSDAEGASDEVSPRW